MGKGVGGAETYKGTVNIRVVQEYMRKFTFYKKIREKIYILHRKPRSREDLACTLPWTRSLQRNVLRRSHEGNDVFYNQPGKKFTFYKKYEIAR